MPLRELQNKIEEHTKININLHNSMTSKRLVHHKKRENANYLSNVIAQELHSFKVKLTFLKRKKKTQTSKLSHLPR